MAYIDVKQTVWARYTLPDDTDIEKVKAYLEINPVLDDLLNNVLTTGVDYELSEETDYEMSLEDNNGFSTIEVFNNNDEKIWENGK